MRCLYPIEQVRVPDSGITEFGGMHGLSQVENFCFFSSPLILNMKYQPILIPEDKGFSFKSGRTD